MFLSTLALLASLVMASGDPVAAPSLPENDRGAALETVSPSDSTARQESVKDVDYHITGDPAHDTYLKSAFAHGHRHGYEEGYHAADNDLQFGRPAMQFASAKQVPEVLGYRKQFGRKDLFREGYKRGFIAGYEDSYAGREFRP